MASQILHTYPTQVFISEQLVYNKAALNQHMARGETEGPMAEAGFTGHPMCKYVCVCVCCGFAVCVCVCACVLWWFCKVYVCVRILCWFCMVGGVYECLQRVSVCVCGSNNPAVL